MDKKQLRHSMRQKLQNLTGQEKKTIEQKLYDQLTTSNLWKQSNTIGITISQKYEWNTKEIILSALKQGKTVAIPKCIHTEKKLKFYQFESYHKLERVYFNLLEPVPEESKKVSKYDIDLLIVPGLVFDPEGFRIGFGGGYYDRFLVDFPHKSVSIISKIQLVESLPVEPYDIPVDYLITEEGFLN